MKRNAWIGVLAAVLAIGLAGCEWETGSGSDSWSSSFDWVNFSGTYRSAAGGLLVTDYTTTPSTPGSTNVMAVTGESQGTFVVNQTAFSGNLDNGNIVPGSASIYLYNDGGTLRTLIDNGNRVLTSGADSGTIDYISGAWSINFNPLNPVTEAGRIRANYSYQISNSGSAGSGARPGSTGSIYSFVVVHKGQNLTVTDNNGAVYEGKISEIRSASGAQNTDIGQVGDDESANDNVSQRAKYTYYESPLPEDGDVIIASFDCSGVSHAGVPVRITGVFQGTVAAGVFTGRTMSGTWIEAYGKTGDINGQTTSLPITTVSADAGTGDTNAVEAATTE